MSTRQLNTPRSQAFSGGCALLFFAAFLFMGLVFAGFMGFSLYQDLQMQWTYVEGECEITAKELLISTGDDSTTYAPYFEYFVYTPVGEHYESSGYRRSQVYSSGRRAKEEVLASYQIERRYPCWYNPANPREAVLSKGLSWGWGYLFMIIPLIFVVVGVGGIASSVFSWGKSPEEVARKSDMDPGKLDVLPAYKFQPGEWLQFRVPVETSHRTAFLLSVILALFWNGIVGVFVVLMLNDGEFMPMLCLAPFILVGLGLIYWAGRQLLTLLTAGKTIVELSRTALQFGETGDLYVIQRGRKEVQSLQVRLRCQEFATYRKGTDTKTDSHILYDEVLHEEIDFRLEGEWRRQLSLRIPPNAMHSFKAKNNEIRWQVVFSMKAVNAPDFELAFPFLVLPPGVYG